MDLEVLCSPCISMELDQRPPGPGRGNTTTISAEAIQGLYTYILEKGSWKGSLDLLRRRVIAHVGHDPGFPPTIGDPNQTKLELVIRQALDIFEGIGITHEWTRNHGKAPVLTLTVVRQDPNAGMVLGCVFHPS